MSDRPRYAEAALPSAEAPRIAPDPAHGERVDQRTGAVIAHLPADMKPCPIVWDDGVHPPEACPCLGTGMIPIRRPAVDGMDPADDSLGALEVAIAEREENGVDPYLGDSVTNLMRPSIPVDARGGGGGRKKKSPTGGQGHNLAAERSAMDGRLERTGRPPRFAKARPERARTTVQPETVNVLDAKDDDVAKIVNELLADPDAAAIIAEGARWR